jgi:hypothetical protein
LIYALYAAFYRAKKATADVFNGVKKTAEEAH